MISKVQVTFGFFFLGGASLESFFSSAGTLDNSTIASLDVLLISGALLDISFWSFSWLDDRLRFTLLLGPAFAFFFATPFVESSLPLVSTFVESSLPLVSTFVESSLPLVSTFVESSLLLVSAFAPPSSLPLVSTFSSDLFSVWIFSCFGLLSSCSCLASGFTAFSEVLSKPILYNHHCVEQF